MFVVMNRLSCPVTYAEHLERAFAHAGNMEKVPGFVSFQFLKNTGDGERLEFIAMTHWESRAAFEAWTKSEAFQQAHRNTGESPVSAVLESYDVL